MQAATRRLVTAFAVSVAVAAAPTAVQGSGYYTHKSVAAVARDWVIGASPALDPALVALLAAHPDAVYSGSRYPDWGYAVDIVAGGSTWGDLAERAHDTGEARSALADPLGWYAHPYRDALLAQLRTLDMTPAARLEAIAFWFGMVSHQVADTRFHDSFLPEALVRDVAGSPTHTTVELGSDGFLNADSPPPASSPVFPVEALHGAYLACGITEAQLTQAQLADMLTTTFVAAAAAAELGADAAAGALAIALPWTRANYATWLPGGVHHQRVTTYDAWMRVWEAESPVTTLATSPAVGADGFFRRAVTVTVGGERGFGGLVSRCRLDGGAETVVTAPVVVSTDGTHVLACSTSDVTGRSGEEATVTLKIDMTPISCGNGIVQAGEECDDGDADDTDGCLSWCVLATCGDAYVRAGVEQCDDGNADDTDDCPSTCVLARCGDGFVRAGVEECDDGNLVDGDGCAADCTREPSPESPGGCGCEPGGGGAGALLPLLALGLRRRAAPRTSGVV